MKAKQNNFIMIFGIIIIAVCINIVQAGNTLPVQWNEMAQSKIMNNTELAKLGDSFPDWKIKQIAWPSISEINEKKVIADPNLILKCTEWLSKFIKQEQLPTNLNEKLIAMKEWGVITKESDEKRLCDVFITRFKIDSMVVHIQESPSDVVIAFDNEKLVDFPFEDHKNFVVDVSKFLLSDKIQPRLDSENLYVHEIIKEGKKITTITWVIDSLVSKKENGKMTVNLSKAYSIGTTGIQAETNGKFIRFHIVKCVKGARIAPDPYEERFSYSK